MKTQNHFYIGQQVVCNVESALEKDDPRRQTWPYSLLPYKGQILTIREIIKVPDAYGNLGIGLRFKEVKIIGGSGKEHSFDHLDFSPYHKEPKPTKKYDLSIFYAMLNPNKETIDKYKKFD